MLVTKKLGHKKCQSQKNKTKNSHKKMKVTKKFSHKKNLVTKKILEPKKSLLQNNFSHKNF